MTASRSHHLLGVISILSFGVFATAPSEAQLTACDDLSHVDFGTCTLLLGVGILNGQCESISGCASPVVLFTSVQQCEATCPTCNDLSGIDFGPCEAILGAGIVEGSCELISGCESPVPLFASVIDCEAMCNVVAVEDVTWSLVKTLYRSD